MTAALADRRWWTWFLASLAGCAVVLAALRFGTGVLAAPAIRDEALMKVPIDDLLARGWTVETMIDYQEVKGPAFFWTCAAAGELLGGSMNDLRLVSALLVLLGLVPVLLVARRCGVGPHALPLVTAFWILLPYQAMTSQLLMSEPSFNCFAAWTLWAFVRVFGDPRATGNRVAGPIFVALGLAILLHHRPHAVAYAGAIALVAIGRDGWRAWPWIAACVAAGVLRLPLWFRWGGMVTSDYQGLFGFGLRVEALPYMLAAVLPALAILLWPALREPAHAPRRWIVLAAFAFGGALGLAAAPDLGGVVRYVLPATGVEETQLEYAGIVATSIRAVTPDGVAARLALALLSALGAASLAALGVLATSRPCDARGAVCRLMLWTLLCGLPLYAITRGPVYDRYLAVWIALMPIVWTIELRAGPRVVQLVALAAAAAYVVARYLV